MRLRGAAVHRSAHVTSILFCGRQSPPPGGVPSGEPSNGWADLQGAAIPTSEVGRGRVRTLKESHQGATRISLTPDGLVRQQEFAETGIESGVGDRLDRSALQSGRSGIGIRIKSGLSQRRSLSCGIPGPETTGEVLLILGQTEEPRNTFEQRSRPAGKPCVREVERSPEEVHGTALAGEVAAKPLEHLGDLD